MIEQRTIRLIGGWLALIGAGVGIGVVPASGGLARTERDVARARIAVQAAKDRPAELERRRAELEAMREFAEAYTKPIPGQGDIAGLVRGLAIYLDERGVPEREIGTGSAAPDAGALAMPMSLAMRADFSTICSTITHIESLPRLVRLSRLKIERDIQKGRPTGLLRAELSLDVLFSGVAEPVAEAGEAKP